MKQLWIMWGENNIFTEAEGDYVNKNPHYKICESGAT